MNQPKSTGLLLIGVGTILTSMVLAGFLLGYVLDVWLDTRPVFMVLLCGLGFIGGILKVYKLLTHPASH
jgi:ATP synthase protein I